MQLNFNYLVFIINRLYFKVSSLSKIEGFRLAVSACNVIVTRKSTGC